ncbi:YagK/YfjJ domain-containing protein [Vibrio metschnikovii]|uniref:YagK/YfjJ domain-containing protein n=1 Tax=Vibrio metschnikovii TaxID=28172 RepID=UPI001C305BA3|nr:inovirus-type Gp2 protein [Vibrio metschnikovii]MDA3137372.1 inovirus-type Gp2 protein [Vibrio metschnikovii]
MRYLTNSPYLKIDGQIWEVNTGSNQQYKICPKHMKAIINQLNAMCSYHKRVMVLFFNLSMPSYTDNNRQVSAFIGAVRSMLAREYSMKRFGYSWVREMEKAKQQHYHVALFLDGKQILYPDRILGLLESLWLAAGGSCLQRVEHCYYRIVDNDFQTKQQAIYRLSYQSKERGKGYRAKQAKDYSTSRLKLRHS